MSSNYRLILASNSPRRKQLLSQLGFGFEVLKVEVVETFPQELEIDKVAEYLAIKKNEACRKLLGQEIVLTADTTVVFGNRILGKPIDREEAVNMLKALSGYQHEVITGVCVSSHDRSLSLSEKTNVLFKSFTPGEINYYVDHYKPYDKAGAYGIQEWLGLMGVEELSGSYFNVMGLPTHEVYRLLTQEFGIHPA